MKSRRRDFVMGVATLGLGTLLPKIGNAQIVRKLASAEPSAVC